MNSSIQIQQIIYIVVSIGLGLTFLAILIFAMVQTRKHHYASLFLIGAVVCQLLNVGIHLLLPLFFERLFSSSNPMMIMYSAKQLVTGLLEVISWGLVVVAVYHNRLNPLSSQPNSTVTPNNSNPYQPK